LVEGEVQSFESDGEWAPTGENLRGVLDEVLLVYLNWEDNGDVNVDQVFVRIILVPKLVDSRLFNVWKIDECVSGHGLTILPPIRQSTLHCLGCLPGIELLGIERPCPFHKIIVLLVVWISQGLEEFGIAPDAADILCRGLRPWVKPHKVALDGVLRPAVTAEAQSTTCIEAVASLHASAS
jgi:hypothetical protein